MLVSLTKTRGSARCAAALAAAAAAAAADKAATTNAVLRGA